MAGFQFVKVSSSNYFCSQGKIIGSEAATLFIPHRYRGCEHRTKIFYNINFLINQGEKEILQLRYFWFGIIFKTP
jgi:hypothetical protein